jgi:hypothetical protein
MKAVILTLAGLMSLATLAGAADAAPRAKKQRVLPSEVARTGSDYVERLADKLPFGSSVWWEQMVRERRGGRPG